MKPQNNIFRKYIPALFILVLSISAFSQERPKGYISGIVTDKATKHPLIGVNVIIENTKMDSASHAYSDIILSMSTKVEPTLNQAAAASATSAARAMGCNINL